MSTAQHRSAVTAFAAAPTSATAARRFVRQTLGAANVAQEICDRAELIVSELVTNAVLHAGTGPIVSIGIDADHIRVSVEDTSASAPVLREYGLDATTGRGLQVVSRAASEWGVDTTPSGKAVWATLLLSNSDDADDAVAPLLTYTGKPPEPRAPNALDMLNREPTCRVTLVNVPARTYAQLESHNESLVREFSLLGIQVQGDEQRNMPQQLRDVVIEAAELDIRFTLLRFAARSAIDNNQDAFSADIKLTASGADRLERYADWARRADDLSEQQLLLTATPPESVRLLREWLVREAVAQVRSSFSEPAASKAP